MVSKEFFKFESQHNLHEWEIDDYPVWDRIRSEVGKQIMLQSNYGEPHTRPSHNIHNYLKVFRLWANNIISHNPFRAGSHDILVIGHPRRKKEFDNKWWDIYFDPIDCDQDFLHTETAYQLRHHHEPKTESLYYLDFIRFSGSISDKIKFPPISFNKYDKEKISLIENSIKELFNAELDVTRLITSDYRKRWIRLKLYTKLLNRINPDLIFLVVSTNHHSLIEASKINNIPVIELQHGVIHDRHLGYSFPGDLTKSIFPDYLFIWGEFWRGNCTFPLPNERIISVGFPYMELMSRQYRDIRSDDQILFLSQGTIGEQLSKFAIEVDQHPNIDQSIVYKLHPGEYDRWTVEYPWLVDASFEIIDNSNIPLYELFAKSSVQVGVNSTAMYEGLCFELQTYVLDCPGSQQLETLIESGAAELITSANELAMLMESNKITFNRDYFFTPNASERICESIDRLDFKSSR